MVKRGYKIHPVYRLIDLPLKTIATCILGILYAYVSAGGVKCDQRVIWFSIERCPTGGGPIVPYGDIKATVQFINECVSH